jgi:hypothetical protein
VDQLSEHRRDPLDGLLDDRFLVVGGQDRGNAVGAPVASNTRGCWLMCSCEILLASALISGRRQDQSGRVTLGDPGANLC